jgi:Acetokinase family
VPDFYRGLLLPRICLSGRQPRQSARIGWKHALGLELATLASGLEALADGSDEPGGAAYRSEVQRHWRWAKVDLMKPASARILTINGGSSSIRFALFEAGDSLRRILEGAIERIGLPEATLRVKGLDQADNLSRLVTAPDDTAAAGL